MFTAKHHIAAHRKMIQDDGQPRKRSPVLSKLRLIDLTNEGIEIWAREEAKSVRRVHG